MSTTAALLALCFGVFGCKHQHLDEDSARWPHYAITVDHRTIAFSLPEGHRIKQRRLPAEVIADKPHTILYDAQYDYGSPGDIAEFQVLISVLAYVQPFPESTADMQAFEAAVTKAAAAALVDPSQMVKLSAKVVALAGGRKWLQFSNAQGVSSYVTPLSDTHALIVGVAYWKKLKADKQWYADRVQLFETIARGVEILDAGSDASK